MLVSELAAPDQRLYQLRQLERRRLCQQNPISFCTHALTPRGEVPAAHQQRIVAELEKIARGVVTRLMVLAPPGSAKTT
jgi:hypothetical protein